MPTDERPGKVEEGSDDQLTFYVEYAEKLDAVCKKYHLSPYDEFKLQAEIVMAGFILVATDADYVQFSEELSKPGNPPAYVFAEGVLAILKERGVNRANVREYLENRIKEFEESARKGMHTPRED